MKSPLHSEKSSRGQTRAREAAAVLMLTVILGAAPAGAAQEAPPLRQQTAKLVAEIRHADYAGDRVALRRLSDELARFADDPQLATRVRYWRGFALWRRAINGFNEEVAKDELQRDLQLGLAEFEQAARQEPAFVEAKVGALGCLSLIGFNMIRGIPEPHSDPDVQELLAKYRQLQKEIQEVAPENPRLLWILGPAIWKQPAERGGGPGKAIELYTRALSTVRAQKMPADPLEPAWGEPELLMSLAWSELNLPSPDLVAARRDAQSALALVPHWHYVRDILMPQIAAAEQKAAREARPSQAAKPEAEK